MVKITKIIWSVVVCRTRWYEEGVRNGEVGWGGKRKGDENGVEIGVDERNGKRRKREKKKRKEKKRITRK